MLASALGHLKVDMSPQLVKATGPACNTLPPTS
jgi:hypothetical protein